MKTGKIFLVGDNEGSLVPMTETDYTTEDILQTLIARYPDLIPGEQINPENPSRWLLVAREMPVPGDESDSRRWSLDHLFLDQDGVPTFIECKRHADTRSRREVVAQMLDYAANGLEYWSMDRLRQAAAESAVSRSRKLDDEILQLMGSDDVDQIEGYWRQVEANLRSGRVRLIFVADSVSRELRRLVEFLNEKMADVEVLAVEIKQFLGEGRTAHVPRVIGATETASEIKAGRMTGGTHTNRGAFLEQCDPAYRIFFTRVLDRAEEKQHFVYWGKVGFSIRARLKHEDRLATFVLGWPAGRFDFYFKELPMSVDVAAGLRARLMDYGVFRVGGDWTIKADLTPETLPRMDAIYDFILQSVDELLKVT